VEVKNSCSFLAYAENLLGRGRETQKGDCELIGERCFQHCSEICCSQLLRCLVPPLKDM